MIAGLGDVFTMATPHERAYDASNMRQNRLGHSMRTLLFIAFSVVVVGCSNRQPPAFPVGRSGVLDLATNGLALCELHHVTVSTQTVDLLFGMKAFTPMDDARPRLFPHADEAYDTRNCIPNRESHAQVFVCARCTEARGLWISTNKVAAPRYLL
jgi:hypothetical protein